MLLLFLSAVVSANSAIAQVLTDTIAEKMLVYQRSIGGWPKAVNNRVVDGWPQYYPKHNIYRGQVTYNDEAMMKDPHSTIWARFYDIDNQ